VGLLSDFVVATSEDALQYESFVPYGDRVLPDHFWRSHYKNVTPLALEILSAILRDEEPDAGLHRLEHVFHTEQTWLFRFPDELASLIAALDERTAAQVADAWARCGEVVSSPDELRPILLDLNHLSGQAQRSRCSLYLWVSL